ncbi:MAG: hypothetical protein A2017_12875 [Lentisphaerae bacterium GWF2_44_16]|nr:MAG: hypothetical protein A2017_12875 [Lentisphaerae bacterium GWF2_44_16]
MKTSAVSSTGNIILINSTTQDEEEQTAAAQTESKKQKLIYRIGDEIVTETVFSRYDLNKDGIISDSEKAAYEKAQGNTGNIINIQA